MNLASRSRMRNRKRRPGVVEVHGEIAGLLGPPGSGGVGGDAEDVHVAGGVLDDDEDIQPLTEALTPKTSPVSPPRVKRVLAPGARRHQPAARGDTWHGSVERVIVA